MSFVIDWKIERLNPNEYKGSLTFHFKDIDNGMPVDFVLITAEKAEDAFLEFSIGGKPFVKTGKGVTEAEKAEYTQEQRDFYNACASELTPAWQMLRISEQTCGNSTLEYKNVPVFCADPAKIETLKKVLTR